MIPASGGTKLTHAGAADATDVVRRLVRAPDLESARRASARLRSRMTSRGQALIAISWHTTRSGVSMELLFAAEHLPE